MWGRSSAAGPVPEVWRCEEELRSLYLVRVDVTKGDNTGTFSVFQCSYGVVNHEHPIVMNCLFGSLDYGDLAPPLEECTI